MAHITAPRTILVRLCLFCSILLTAGSIQGQMAPGQKPSESADFSAYYDRIYQIQVVANGAGSKASIGSGFQIDAKGLIVTNYHVVANYVNAPESYHINYLDQTGQTGELELLDFDVVNDLAILRHPAAAPQYFELATKPMRKGELIYALGNPHDFGITLVFGAYNGNVEHSFEPQILFSGSLNPGMSGGPGLNEDGQIVGVNVATAGSQLSFLVPVERVRALRERQRTLDAQQYFSEIAAQVLAWQQKRIGSLLEIPWPQEALGNATALGQIRHDFQCWGTGNEQHQNRTVDVLQRRCNSGNQLYINGRLSTGEIHYAFEQQRSLSLNAYRFHQNLSARNISGDNRVSRTSVTPYECDNSFLETNAARSAGTRKATFCVRAYKRLPGLYDVLFLAEDNANQSSHDIHFTLAGVDKTLAQAFATKFMAELSWK